VLLAGCKSACNRHGTCALQDGEYHCVCSDGWAGLDCSIRLEIKCNDEIDNDEGENRVVVNSFVAQYCMYIQ
jgi:hypothetical protein